MVNPAIGGARLHYIHDPLCGWCYGAAPLVAAARRVLPVVLHGGGMMAGHQRQPVTPQLRSYVMPHDHRIGQLTGQPFGERYFEGLLRDTGAVFDSGPPITAVLAAEQMAARGADLLARVQVAHYQEGRRIAEADVLKALAVDIGLDGDAFAAAFAKAQGEPTLAHIRSSRKLLAEVGGSGFPTLVLEHEGAMQGVDFAGYLGRPEAFEAWLRARLPNASLGDASGGGFGCSPDGCAI